MAKQKAGLHKAISSIFDGVPLRKDSGTQQPPHAPSPDRTDDGAHSKPNKEPLAAPAPSKPPVTGTELVEPSKPQQPPPPEPRVVPREQPKAAPIKDVKPSTWQQTYQQIKEKLFAPKPGVNTGRQKTMVILVPILLIVFVFVFVKVLFPPARGTHASAPSGPTDVVPDSTGKIDWQIPDPYPTTLRDPMKFAPVPQDTVDPGKIIVKAITHSQDSPSALIGTQIVHKGDQVNGAKIIEIYKDAVEFEMNGKTWMQKVE